MLLKFASRIKIKLTLQQKLWKQFPQSEIKVTVTKTYSLNRLILRTKNSEIGIQFNLNDIEKACGRRKSHCSRDRVRHGKVFGGHGWVTAYEASYAAAWRARTSTPCAGRTAPLWQHCTDLHPLATGDI